MAELEKKQSKEEWIDENIDQLSEEFEDYWFGIKSSGSAWEINKDQVRDDFFEEKYLDSQELEINL